VQSDGTIRKYYSFAGQTIAVFNLTPDTGTPDTLSYFLTDHLGSIVAVTDSSGTLITQQRYLPFGEVRQLPGYTTTRLTDYAYTGQRDLGDDLDLMDYRARFYHPVLARFIQPDTIVPGASNPQAFNRYSYVNNNPLRYTDPSGHWPEWLSYVTGALTQYIDDNLFGAFYAAFGANADTIADPAFQKGRELGHAISTTQAIVEVTIGAAMIEAAASSIPPTVGGGLACAAVSGGTCAVPTGLVVTGEAVLGVEGMLLAGHGGVMLARAGSGSNVPSNPYPKVIDPRTGDFIPEPPEGLKPIPHNQRVLWGKQQRAAYIREWYDRGYPIPDGGWENYDLHHIIPREYGGTNDFWNIVPIERKIHQQQFNLWWNSYGRIPR
jgi:RHS repeat-associated protein